jgi:hypothetical protein
MNRKKIKKLIINATKKGNHIFATISFAFDIEQSKTIQLLPQFMKIHFPSFSLICFSKFSLASNVLVSQQEE